MDSTLKILLAAEATPLREALARAIEERGFSTRVASKFELPFAAAHEQPDLVVVDAGKLGAAEVSRLVKESALECPVAVFSESSPDELRELETDPAIAACLRETDVPAVAAAVARLARRWAEEAREHNPPIDYVELARRSTREQFVAASQCPFLVSSANLISQADEESTADILDPDLMRAVDAATREAHGPSHPERKAHERSLRPAVMAFAIRSGREGTAGEITVGRARDVDIYIDHATISKHHARFIREEGGLRVADAGSRNGSWASGRFLQPNGPPSPTLESEDRVRLGELEFTYLSAAAAWDVLRVNVR